MLTNKALCSLILGTGIFNSFVIFNLIDTQISYAQFSLPGNSTSNDTITASQARKTIPYQGDSVKLIVVSSLVREDQWKPIDNYTSNGWEIKAMVPYMKRHIVVLEKEQVGNETRP